jgi:hypothetical protein
VPRGERPLEPGEGPLLEFAADLRKLREAAGSPTYRVLAARVNFSAAALSDAAGGRKLPSLPVALAYVRGCDGDTEVWEGRWRSVAAELAGPPRPDADGEAPYVGFAAFQLENADRFFGREGLVEEIAAKLRDRSFVGVFGASGAGKSSILRAGLQSRFARTALFAPGADPLGELAHVLAAVVGCEPREVRSRLNPNPDDLGVLLPPHRDELVVLVDQFEEVFTHGGDAKDRDRFFRVLVALGKTPGCRVVVSVRADYHRHCAEHAVLVEALRDAQITIGPMTAAELRSAIVKPAALSRIAVEGALLVTIAAEAVGDAGALPALSHALLETWRRRRGATMTLDGYQAAGGISGALAQTAEQVYQRLEPEQRELTRRLLLRLTAADRFTGDTKRRVPMTELDLTGHEENVVERLTRARLLIRDRDTVEIAHEALLRGWPRLRSWLSDDREGRRIHHRLAAAADNWHTLGREPGALYRGLALEAALEWRRVHGGEINQREREFLDASNRVAVGELAAARQHVRRYRRLSAVLCGLLLVAVVATVVAVRARMAVAEQRNVALSEIAAGKAATLRPSNPALAAQLSLAAYQLASTDAARQAVLNSVPTPYQGVLSGHTDHVNAVAFGPAARTGATASHDGTAILWDITDHARARPLSRVTGHTGNVNDVAISPDGRLLATAGWDHTARLWDISEPAHPAVSAVLGTHRADVNSVAFSADGRLLVTSSTDRTTKLWDVADARRPAELATLTGGGAGAVSAVISPDRTRVATANWDGTTLLWNISDPRHPATPTVLRGHLGPVVGVVFSPDSRTLASASQDRTVRLWTVDRPDAAPVVVSGHTGTVRSVAFDPSGTILATASEDQTVRIWRLSGRAAPTLSVTLRQHAAAVVAVRFAADGTLMTGSDDDTALLWQIPAADLAALSPEDAAVIICQVTTKRIDEDTWNRYLPGANFREPCSVR